MYMLKVHNTNNDHIITYWNIEQLSVRLETSFKLNIDMTKPIKEANINT